MFINDAKSMDKILENLETGVSCPRQVGVSFRMHRDAMKFYSKNANATPTDENYQEAISFIEEACGVLVPIENMKNILALFPSARIKLAVYDGTTDTEVRDLIYEVACSYFAGSKSPTYGDQIKSERFMKHLQSQAKDMGFEVVTE